MCRPVKVEAPSVVGALVATPVGVALTALSIVSGALYFAYGTMLAVAAAAGVTTAVALAAIVGLWRLHTAPTERPVRRRAPAREQKTSEQPAVEAARRRAVEAPRPRLAIEPTRVIPPVRQAVQEVRPGRLPLSFRR